MAWTGKYEQTTNVPRTGTLSATWVDPLDATNTFFYSEARVDEQTSLAGFVTRAKAALVVDQTKKGQAATISGRITTALNA